MKGISDTLNMKSLEEILAETEHTEENDQDTDAQLPVIAPSAENALIELGDMKGSDHGVAMDEIYDEALDVARKIIDMGMNIDPSRAPRILEVGGQYFKTALDAKNSKRDAQLKLMKLIQDQRRLDLEERKINGELGNQPTLEGEVVYEGDRNKLRKILRAQREANESPEGGPAE